VYVTPKEGTKRDFAVLPVKSDSVEKNVATKFLCVKTSSDKIVATGTSFLYLTVHRRIAGDVAIYLTFALKVTHPVGIRRFRQTSLNNAAGKFNYR